MKRILSLLMTIIMTISLMETSFAAERTGLDNFTRKNSYRAGQFSDVKSADWFAGSVKKAYELGLIKGASASSYNPSGNITIAETLALACRLREIFFGGTGTFEQGATWYQVYVDYAIASDMITPTQFRNYNATATRAEFAAIMAKSLPSRALNAINTITDIPDVHKTADYADAVYLLYNAGILTGSDSYGTFYPSNSILRSEVAAIVTRMADQSERKVLSISQLLDNTDTPDSSERLLVDDPSSTPQAVEKKKLTLATGGTAGRWYQIGKVLQDTLNEKLELSKVVVESSGGAVANINMLAEGTAQAAILQSDVLDYAHKGTFTFEYTGAKTSALWVAGIYKEYVQIVARPGINTISDLRGKTVCVGDVGSSSEVNAWQVLNAVGLSRDDLVAYSGSFQEGIDGIKNGTIDAAFTIASVPSTAIVDYAVENDLNLISLSESEISRITAEYPFMIRDILPAETYRDYDEEVVCVAVQATLVADETVPTDVVYELTKAIFENRSELTSGNAMWDMLSSDPHIGRTVPLHPGAEKYYREIGIL